MVAPNLALDISQCVQMPKDRFGLIGVSSSKSNSQNKLKIRINIIIKLPFYNNLKHFDSFDGWVNGFLQGN
ncbi:hypothetical protein B0682_01250 [Moraxella lincolnii]|uniref:Uncharacterized protein n=1 Tax=Lwoffella lincolnii TaxID=90241 RepID=A0A1T0CKG3_9GAMM|nr:hypothetical protein B0682_01250 [Moraxella lincolnii]